MRRLMLACAILLVPACAKKDAPPVTDAAAAPSIHLADLAGEWDAVATRAGSDSVLVSFKIIASADPMNWAMAFPGRDQMVAMTVGVSGDSILTQSEPYESALRAGVTVTVNGSMKLTDGVLSGPTVAHYATTDADSVVNLWISATRAMQ